MFKQSSFELPCEVTAKGCLTIFKFGLHILVNLFSFLHLADLRKVSRGGSERMVSYMEVSEFLAQTELFIPEVLVDNPFVWLVLKVKIRKITILLRLSLITMFLFSSSSGLYVR